MKSAQSVMTECPQIGFLKEKIVTDLFQRDLFSDKRALLEITAADLPYISARVTISPMSSTPRGQRAHQKAEVSHQKTGRLFNSASPTIRRLVALDRSHNPANQRGIRVPVVDNDLRDAAKPLRSSSKPA
jgi:hypothetical protein